LVWHGGGLRPTISIAHHEGELAADVIVPVGDLGMLLGGEIAAFMGESEPYL
jgi:hypothetical protein